MTQLQGIRVLDLSRLYPGPLASLMLSDMGAEVIKVEDLSGDGMRHFPPFAKDGNSISFHAMNRGKKSITLDLKSKNGRDQLFSLIKDADVLIESFRPLVLEKLLQVKNIEELLQINPKLVVARISAFGQSAPSDLKNIPAHDMNSLARAGVFHINNLSKHAPSPMPIQAADLLSGYTCCMQICAALFAIKNKNNTNGTVIDVSMYDVSLASIMMPLSKYLYNKEAISGGRDALSGSLCCYDIYKTKDGFLSVACLEVHFWRGFAKAIGLHESLHGPKAMFCTGEDKNKLQKLIQEKLMNKSAHEWEKLLAFELKLPVLELRAPETALEDPMIKSRRMISDMGDGFSVFNPGLDYTSFLSSKELDSQHAPALGEHNNQILSRL
ncbi:acetyl-CoA:oxalate CoA-transferase [Acrasis kona]|uniref:Acetyl-CoA:oxalate CoA-transferase n=1 Tax=Acrasis kona TaxID=1008807 RepID=A0AAW2ZPM0_9EUKA